jgi:hypothetical protein
MNWPGPDAELGPARFSFFCPAILPVGVRCFNADFRSPLLTDIFLGEDEFLAGF